MTLLTPLLADLPPTGYYFHPFKIFAFFVCMAIFWYAGAWIDKDTGKVRANRDQWNALTFGGGLLALFLWLVVPSWWLGLLLYLVVYGGPLTAYIIYRNGRVSPAQTVLTPAHFRRLSAGKKAETEEAIHQRDRVRIKGADGRYPSWPTDPVQHDGYQALQDLLFDALWRRASDVDLTLQGQQCRIVYKVDGVRRERDPLPRQQAEVVVAHFKRIGGMDPAEIRKPQEGKLFATIGAGGSSDKSVEIMLKSLGSTAGQRLELKIHAAESRFRVNEVGFTKAQLAVLEPLVDRLDGLVICSGPKESGVTSLLYAMIRQHDAFMRNIHTLEVQKVMDIENVSQHVHDAKGGQVSFSRQLQSILRTDPDIVMVGDCVDAETAALSAEYATQKKIYLGLNAADSFDGLQKYQQFVGDNPLTARSLLAVINGRLIRKLCTNCRKGYRPDISLLQKANLPTDQNKVFYRPPNREELEVDKQGNPIICPVCQGSGYLGRTGIFELLVIDDALRPQIAQGASLNAIRALARKNKMANLQDIGLQKVYEGVTSINEVLRVTKEE